MNESKNDDNNNLQIPKDSTIENEENPRESLKKDNIEIKENININNSNHFDINNNQKDNIEKNNSQIEKNDDFNENNQFPNTDEDNFENKDDNFFENKENIHNKDNGNNNTNDNKNEINDNNNNNKEENLNDEEKIDESNNNEINNNNNNIRFSSIKNDDINNSNINNNNNEPSGFVYDEENENENDNENNIHGNETNKKININKEPDDDFGFRESNNNGFDNHNYENDFDFGNNQNNFNNSNNNNNNNINNNINNNNNVNIENNQNKNHENQNSFSNFNFNYFNNNNLNNPFTNTINNNNNNNNNYIQNGGINDGQNIGNQTTSNFIPQETPIFNNLNNNNFSIDQNQEDMHPDYDPQYKKYIELPEDSDGLNLDSNKMGKDSTKTAGAQIANTIMGAGILSIPIIMRYLGIVLGSFFIIFLALSTIYSVYILIRCHEITGKYGFSMFGKITMGNFGNILIKIIIIINNIGLCIAYFRIFGEVVQTIIQAWVSPESFWATNWHNYVFILLCGIIMLFFIFTKNISSLKKVAYLGVCVVLIFSISLVILLIYKTNKHYLDNDMTWNYLIPNCTFSEAFHAIPTVFLAFLFQFNVFPIYLSLKHRNMKTMMKATKYGVGYSLIIFLIVGIIGFLLYGLSMEETILDSFDQDMIKYRNTSTFIKILIIIICISFVTTCLTSFPILFLSLRENFFNSLLFCSKNCCKKKNNDNEDVEISQGKYERKNNIGDKGMIIITFILYFIILAMAIALPKLKIIFSVVGATAGTFIAFILPNLFYIRICKMSGKNYNIVLPLIFFAFGLFFLVVSITVTFI